MSDFTYPGNKTLHHGHAPIFYLWPRCENCSKNSVGKIQLGSSTGYAIEGYYCLKHGEDRVKEIMSKPAPGQWME